MNKIAQVQVIVKLARYIHDPMISRANKDQAITLAKKAGIFDGLGDSFGDAANSFGSTVSNFASSAMSNLQQALPFGTTWETVLDKLKQADPSMGMLLGSAGPEGVEALKQAAGEMGPEFKDVLSALGIG